MARSSSRLLAPRRAVAAAIVAAVAAVGCGAPEYHYVKSSETSTYLKVPRQWARFDESEILDLEAELARRSGRPQTAADRETAEAIQWRVAFDADPDPSVRHIVALAEKPTVDATVRLLLPAERDGFNMASLRNVFLDYDGLRQQRAGEEASDVEAVTNSDFRPLEEEVLDVEGMRGVRLVFNIRARDGTVYTFNQTAMVDGETRLLYTLLIVAEESEYVAHHRRIDEVARSFTVKAKD